MKSDDARTRPDSTPAGEVAADRDVIGISDALAIVMAKLDAEELAYFSLNKIEGKSASRIAAELGWNSVKIERVRRRLNLHLATLRRSAPALPASMEVPQIAELPWAGGAEIKKRDGRFRAKTPCRIYSFSRGGSLNPFYREALGGGLSMWALSPSNQSYLPNLPYVEAPTNRRGISMKDQKQQLKAERERLTRIGERTHTIRLSTEESERALREAKSELQAEMSNAVLEERAPAAASIEKKILRLQAEFDTKQAELDGALKAQSLQISKVETLESEIIATRHQAFLAATLSDRQRIRSLIDELACAMSDYQGVACRYGQSWNVDLFPMAGPDFLAGSSYRSAALQVSTQALRVAENQWQVKAGSVLQIA